MLRAISKGIDDLIEFIGSSISWLSFALVMLICLDVFLRYLFSSTKTWILDLEWHFFSLIFLFGASFALKHDQHVRVDLFYQKMNFRQKAWVNFIGSAFLLVPWCLLIIVKATNYAMNSWDVKEGSPDGGLTDWYIIKFCIVIGFFLLLSQAISEMIKSLLIILKKN